MNSWKMNANIGTICKRVIIDKLGINFYEIYKAVKNITNTGIIETRDGKKYQLKLEEL